MKSQAEIQRAHDLLIGIIVGDVPQPFKPDSLEFECIKANCDVLCWLLEHDHNPTFAVNLISLEAWTKKHGFTLENKGN